MEIHNLLFIEKTYRHKGNPFTGMFLYSERYTCSNNYLNMSGNNIDDLTAQSLNRYSKHGNL